MSVISTFLEQHYPSQGGQLHPFVQQVEQFWNAFEPYADPGFAQAFCTNDSSTFQQRYWELFLGATFLRQGLSLRRNTGEGPDFSFAMPGCIVWVEAISPTPGIGSNQIPVNPPQALGTPLVTHPVPAEEILLRHTTAIEKKVQQYRSYREDEIVTATDPFIIAIDSSQLGDFGFDGISGYPATLEAVYPIGPQQFHFPIGTTQPISSDIQYRPSVTNANLSPVPTTCFLDQAYSGISGIISTSCSWRDQHRIPPIPLILIHNKVADNPMLPSPIRVDVEYYLDDVRGGYQIRESHEQRSNSEG
jgi:type I restriction enzyme S subunit